ncbi:molybdopterin adenylyltransferase [Anaerolineales bacterium HSG24]|nr:molybdopterin adenylyltransferase [Anaerolineales bacterium HSG24]
MMSENHKSEQVKIGIVTVSDRASRGEYEDRSGPAVQAYLESIISSNWQPITKIVPDEAEILTQTLVDLADEVGCCLIITTGGTGPTSRDITPDITTHVCNKLLPGFGEVMRRISFDKVPTAILSRQIAGIREQTLLVNLPGSPKAIQECLEAVFPAIPHCISLIGGPTLTISHQREVPVVLHR